MSPSPPTATSIWPAHAHALAGLWSCIDYHLYNPDDNSLHSKPHGDSPLGIVQLSPSGYLSAHIARRERFGKLPSGKKWQLGDPEEVAFVAKGLSMYCGRVELHEDEQGLWWRTKVDVATDPERPGGWEVRRLDVVEWEDEDRDGKGKRVKTMELRPKQDLFADDGTPTRAVLRWERIE